jgi:hypothetical protein
MSPVSQAHLFPNIGNLAKYSIRLAELNFQCKSASRYFTIGNFFQLEQQLEYFFSTQLSIFPFNQGVKNRSLPLPTIYNAHLLIQPSQSLFLFKQINEISKENVIVWEHFDK